jgi:hypothetical protein
MANGSDDGQPGPKGLPQHSFVQRLKPEPAQPAKAVTTLTGLPGDSDRPGYQRLYLTTRLDYYAEFLASDIVHSEPVPADKSPFPGVEATRVSIARDATIHYVWVKSPRPVDEFDLDIRLGSGARPTATAAAALVTHTCPDNTVCDTCHGECDQTAAQTCATCPQTCGTCATCPAQTCQTCVGLVTCETCPGLQTCQTCPGLETCQTCQTCPGLITCQTCAGQQTCQTCAGQQTCQTCVTCAGQQTCHTCQTCAGQQTCHSTCHSTCGCTINCTVGCTSDTCVHQLCQ